MRTRKSSIVGKMCFFIIISTLCTALAISIVSKKSMSSSIKEERDGKAAFIARVIQEELGDDVIEDIAAKGENSSSYDDFKKLMLLQVADAKAHVMLPVIEKRVEICEKLSGSYADYLQEQILAGR